MRCFFMRIVGKTVFFDKVISVVSSAGVVGKKEGEGPLAKDFDEIFEDTLMGEESYELAESAMLKAAVTKALEKANKTPKDVDFILGGDLLDQCMGSAFGYRDFEIPAIGLFGACSTMALSICVGSMLVDAGAERVICSTSSHFASSERQFRFPLEYGGQRPPTAQWTVTGAGAALLEPVNADVKIKAIQIGTITDLGITDANNMGAAMAPAAARTIFDFLNDTNTKPEDYDLILTGDLGYTGSDLLCDLMKIQYNIDLKPYHNDCGKLIFNLKEQDVNSGGSGCGCGGSVLCSHIIKRMLNKELKKVLFVATGALMSPTSSKQGRPILGVAHAVLLEV